MRKGISPAVVVLSLIFICVIAAGLFYVGYSATVSKRAPTPTIEYDGEIDDGFLASKGWFPVSFTEGTDCNITSDILGHGWTDCLYETSTALNATASAHMSDHDLYFPWVLDVDGPIEKMEIDFTMGAGSSTTGVPTDDVDLVGAALWTHEDEPELVYEMKDYIEDIEDLDAELDMRRFIKSDEYVIFLTFHTKTISPAFTDGDDIGRLTIDITTDEDQDKAQVTLESG